MLSGLMVCQGQRHRNHALTMQSYTEYDIWNFQQQRSATITMRANAAALQRLTCGRSNGLST